MNSEQLYMGYEDIHNRKACFGSIVKFFVDNPTGLTITVRMAPTLATQKGFCSVSTQYGLRQLISWLSIRLQIVSTFRQNSLQSND